MAGEDVGEQFRHTAVHDEDRARHGTASSRRHPPLQFPDGKAPEVQVECIQSGHATGVLKLHLNLAVVAPDGPRAHRAGEPHPGAGPGPIRAAGRQGTRPGRFVRLLAENRFVVHRLAPSAPPLPQTPACTQAGRSSQMPGAPKTACNGGARW